MLTSLILAASLQAATEEPIELRLLRTVYIGAWQNTDAPQALSLANKLFEYLQAGLPMVVSDLPAQSELMRELDAGEILPEVTPAAIATGVGKLAALPEDERRTWGARLRAAAHEKYCWEMQSPKLVAVYDRVLERAR